MALRLLTDAILKGEPIRVLNHGDMRRDFSFIDVIVAGVVAVTDSPPTDDGTNPQHRVYNIGTTSPNSSYA